MQPNVTDFKKLYNEAFPDEEDFCDRFFERFFDIENTVYIAEGEKLLSALHLLPVKLKCGKEIYNGSYIFAAATDENYRNRGLMTEVINEAKQKSADRNDDFLFLIPCNETVEKYYAKFGFVKVSDHIEEETVPNDKIAKEGDFSVFFNKLKNRDGLFVDYGEKMLSDMLYVYGANVYNDSFVAYKAGNIAVVPKTLTDDFSCASNLLQTDRTVAILSEAVMVIALTQRAEDVKKFNLDFLFN